VTNDPSILFVKPKSVSQADKKALRQAGVVIVEIDDPQSVKFIKASAEIDGSELLNAAIKAINEHNHTTASVKALFGRAICAAIEAKAKP
jgi:hypothetical protein